jgi:hypothetical protein
MDVIYSGCSNTVWLDVAKILRDRYGWQPVYWIGYVPWIGKVFNDHFPEVPFHADVDAVLGVPQSEYKDLPGAVLDQVLLEKLAVCELYAIKMMDRMDALGSFSYQERVRHYRRLVGYWLAVLDKLQPALVFFVDIPHMVYDYILYELCRLKGIATMMFEASNVFGLSFLREKIDGETLLTREYNRLLQREDLDAIELSPEVERFLESLRGNYQNVPLYIRYVSHDDLNEKNTLFLLVRKLLDFKNYNRYFRKQMGILRYQLQKPQSYLKEPGKTPEASSISNLGFRWFRQRAYRKMKTLKKYYHELTAKEIALDQPYLFIALSYQPEATTSPKGDFFVNLELMVDMVSKAVSEGWLLYVKEHPSQFERSWTHRSQSAREKYLYDDLAAMKNVRLVPTSFSSYDLLDHAVAVATVTGSVGWQAVNRGKPALVFGNPWYLGCEGVFHVRAYQDCVNALRTIREGYRVDDQKVKIFAAALEHVGMKLDLEGKTKKFQDGYVAGAKTIAEAMQYFLNGNPDI